eukprot:8525237-Karenia_brevis.AAC.1
MNGDTSFAVDDAGVAYSMPPSIIIVEVKQVDDYRETPLQLWEASELIRRGSTKVTRKLSGNTDFSNGCFHSGNENLPSMMLKEWHVHELWLVLFFPDMDDKTIQAVGRRHHHKRYIEEVVKKTLKEKGVH